MNERNYKKRLDFQQKVISKKTEKIESLELENKRQRLELEEKDKVINSITPLRDELIENINEIKKYKKEYEQLILELKKMKNITDCEAYKNKWWLIKLFLK